MLTYAGESTGENRVYLTFTVLQCKGPDQDWTSPTGGVVQGQLQCVHLLTGPGAIQLVHPQLGVSLLQLVLRILLRTQPACQAFKCKSRR